MIICYGSLVFFRRQGGDYVVIYVIAALPFFIVKIVVLYRCNKLSKKLWVLD